MKNDDATSAAGQPGDRLETLAQQKQQGVVRDFAQFLLENKKWWMIPIAVVLLLAGILVVLGSSGAAPFIYTLF